MAEFVVGRVVSLEGGRPVIQRFPTVSPAKAARIAALVAAARQYKAATPIRRASLIENLLAAALAVD